MATSFGTVTVNTANPDPARAIHAFLRVMEKARSCGFTPKTEHTIAEHFLRGEVNLLFFSNYGGITAICMDDDALSDDDAFEMIQFVYERRRKRLAEKRAAAKEAPEGENATTETEADAPEASHE